RFEARDAGRNAARLRVAGPAGRLNGRKATVQSENRRPCFASESCSPTYARRLGTVILVRALIARFSKLPEERRGWAVTFGPVTVKAMDVPRVDPSERHILFIAEMPLHRLPKVISGGRVKLPSDAIRRCEAGLERLANLIALAENSGRLLMAPIPSLAV